MSEPLRDLLIRKGWVTSFNADTLVRLIEQHYAEQSEPEEPTDEEIMRLMPQQMHEDLATAARAIAEQTGIDSTKVKGAMRIMLNRHVVDLARVVLARWGRPSPQPIPVSERLPGHIEQALIKAECALSDIAEGEAEESEGDPLEWAEKRAADALARIRPVMRQHQIQTSEWPPLPAHALPLPS